MDKKQELCLACMECCKILLVPLPEDPPLPQRQRTYNAFFSPNAFDFYKRRGCTPWTAPDGRKWLVVDNYRCPELNDLTGCMIYEDRPKFCREYDGRTDPYLKHICKWKELNDG